ncbi:MAG: hypothetical protein ACP5US_05515 [Candidatus Kryptoniota bacterium]
MRRRMLIGAIAMTLITLFAAGFLFIKGSRGYADKDRNEEGVESEKRTLIKEGVTYVILDSLTLNRNGIELMKLSARTGTVSTSFYGSVVNPENILSDESDFSSAKGVYESAKSRRVVSEKELHRLKILNETKNVSDKVLDEAKSHFVMDKSSEASALKNLELVKSRILLKWGDRISSWIFENDEILSKLIKGKLEIIEAGIPLPGASIESYKTAMITTSSGSSVEAKFFGFSSVADPVFQGRAVFFLTTAPCRDLIPGMSVIANVPAGSVRTGVFVPDAAVVWYRGIPWVYYEKDPGEFCRVEISHAFPQQDGYFAIGILKPGDVIVSKGAQLLLSEEFKSQIRAED